MGRDERPPLQSRCHWGKSTMQKTIIDFLKNLAKQKCLHLRKKLVYKLFIGDFSKTVAFLTKHTNERTHERRRR